MKQLLLLLDCYKAKLRTIYTQIETWWRMRQYIKELKNNTEPFHWGGHKKTFDYNKQSSIDTLIAGIASNRTDKSEEI